MTDRMEITNLTLEQVERLRSEYAQRGAQDFRVTPQPDGLYALSFLPGDPDFPTDLPPPRSAR